MSHTDDASSVHGRKGRRLSISSLGRLSLGRSSSFRRSNAQDDGEAPSEPPAQAVESDYDDDDASCVSSDDESVMFGNEPEEEDEPDVMFDESTIRNTLINAQMLPGESNNVPILNYEDEDLLDPSADEFQTAPNIVFARSEKELHDQHALLVRNGLPTTQPGRPRLTTVGPIHEKHRCTVMMTYGDYDACHAQLKRPKRYIVASDSSEGSQYAINWAMGTVLRDGDETLIVSVMDAEAKAELFMNKDEPSYSSAIERALQEMTVFLCHQAFVLLQRTRLGVRVSCQAVHSTNARHMLLDIVDFYSPTMVIVGSRGIDGIRGMLGSMSHYLVQKCSVPVMVCHNKLQLPRLPRGKADVVKNVRLRHTRLDQAVVEKYTSKPERMGENDDDDDDDENDDDDAPQESPARRYEREVRESERMVRLNRKSLERRGQPDVASPPPAHQNP